MRDTWLVKNYGYVLRRENPVATTGYPVPYIWINSETDRAFVLTGSGWAAKEPDRTISTVTGIIRIIETVAGHFPTQSTVEESDPFFMASVAAAITALDVSAWNAGIYPAEEFTSSWGDVASRKIYTTEANKRVYAVTVIVTEAYNGTGATLTIGDSGDVDRLFPATAIDLTAIGTYEYHPAHLYVSAVDINVYNTPGAGASSGSCQIIIEHQK